MTKRRVLHAKKYQVVVNDYLIGEVCDKMALTPARRGVVVNGMNAVRLALTKAGQQSESFGTTLRELGRGRPGPHAPVVLYELCSSSTTLRRWQTFRSTGATSLEGSVRRPSKPCVNSLKPYVSRQNEASSASDPNRHLWPRYNRLEVAILVLTK